MLSISLYYISIVTEFTTYYTWYYIYTGCYTLSISKTSISPRGRSERGLTRKAQESKITRREKIERRQISSKTMEAWTASNMPTGADISLSLHLEVLINSRVFLVQIFNIDTEQEPLLRKIVIRTRTTGNANRRNSMDTDTKRNTGRENLGDTRTRSGKIYREFTTDSNEPWIQPADRRQNACTSSRSTGRPKVD